jgi:RNA-binding protein
MAKLKGSQRKHLRGLAHSYKPAVQIGKEGMGDNVVDAIDTALEARELIKVKIAAQRDEHEAAIPIIEDRLDCECVGMVGKMVILYRQHPDPERRKITLD